MKRILSRLMYEIICKKLPLSYRLGGKLSNKLRYYTAKAFIQKCGVGVNFEKGASISSKLIIGDNSGIGQNAIISGSVVIGDNVMMGPDCIIYTRNHSFSDVNTPIRLQGFDEEKTVYIGNDVWIGGRVIILPGRKIGDGSVLGAGSVITKDVPSYAVVGGNPARVLKYRKIGDKQNDGFE